MVAKPKTFEDILRTSVEKMAVPLGALSSLSTIVMMVAISIDVVARNTAGEPIPGLLELSEMALVATVFLGIAYAGTTNAHVSVDLLTSKLPTKSRRMIAGLMWLLGSGMIVWFIMSTFDRAIQSTEMSEVTLGLVVWPIWPARWLIVIGYVAFLIVALANAYLSFRNEPLLGEDEDALANDEAQDSSSTGQHVIAPEVDGTEKKS
ncbi:hypothetical protein GCM10009720_28890 [Yaniella flava]|uniref:Tripartite ATP-independent periplasmic transporters DctQ component domain-containing protein n=1 Tax=Yaniella flava TaxID=287930 RepID=A0ABN2UYJ1_9MICC